MQKRSFLFLGLLFFPLFVHADGGMQKVAEGKYIVNVSSAPIAPYTGEIQKMLIGFADINGNLLEKDISIDLAVHFEQKPIFAQKNLRAKGGILPFEYIYEKPGLYELFVAFRLPDESDHTYMPEDFLIEVKERTNTALPLAMTFLTAIVALFLGFMLGKLF